MKSKSILFNPILWVFESDFYLLLANPRFVPRYLQGETYLAIYEFGNYSSYKRCFITGFKRGFKFTLKAIASIIFLLILASINSNYSIDYGNILEQFAALLVGVPGFIYFFGALKVKRDLFKANQELKVREAKLDILKAKPNELIKYLVCQHIDINFGSIETNKSIINHLKATLPPYKYYATDNLTEAYDKLNRFYTGSKFDTFILHPKYARLLDVELDLLVKIFFQQVEQKK